MKDLVMDVKSVFRRRKKDFLAPHVIILTMVSVVIVCANAYVMYAGDTYPYTDQGFKLFMETQILALYPIPFVTMCLLVPGLITIPWVKRRKARQDWLYMTRLGSRRNRRDERMVAAVTSGAYALIVHVSAIIFLMMCGCPFQCLPMEEVYEDATRYFCLNQALNLMIYIIFSALGFALFAVLIDDLCASVKHTVLIRVMGLFLGIGMYVIPCLAQVYLPRMICEIAIMPSLLMPSGMRLISELPPLMDFVGVVIFYTAVDKGLVKIQKHRQTQS